MGCLWIPANSSKKEKEIEIGEISREISRIGIQMGEIMEEEDSGEVKVDLEEVGEVGKHLSYGKSRKSSNLLKNFNKVDN